MVNSLYINVSNFPRLIERVPQALAKFGVECLHLLHDAVNLVPFADFVERTGLYGGDNFGEISPKTQIGLVYAAERTNERYGKFIHREAGGHGRESTVEGKVHHSRLQQVVAVVSQGYFVVSVGLRVIE